MTDTSQDGITHLNIYSQGATILGRFLSNFTPCQLDTQDGRFASVEGYWYWLSCDPTNARRDELRGVSGFAAKKLGRQLGRQLGSPDYRYDGDFKARILEAIRLKLEGNPLMLGQLRKCQLPLRHYYVYGGRAIEDGGSQWMLDYLEMYAKDAL